MQALKTVAKIVGILFFHVGLWILLSFFVFSRFFSTPDYILQTAEDSGVYIAAADEIVRITTEEQGASISGVVVSEEEYRQALGQVITPEFLQTQLEAIFSGFYEWLEGNTEEPRFTLNAENERESLADVFSRLAVEKLEELPVCASADQLRTDVSPRDITCVPPEFNAEETREEIQRELLESTDFFSDTELSSEELLDGESDFADSNVPREFERAKMSWIYGGIILGLGVGTIVSVSSSRRKAIRSISIQLLIVGAGLGLLALLVIVVGSTVSASTDLNSLRMAGVYIFKDFTTTLNQIVLRFAAVSTLLGFSGLLFSRPAKEQAEDSSPEEKPIQE